MRLPIELVYSMLKHCDTIETRISFGIFGKIHIPSSRLYKIPPIVLGDEEEYNEVYYVLLDTKFPSAYYFLEYVVGGDRKIRYRSHETDTYMVFNIEDQTCLHNL